MKWGPPLVAFLLLPACTPLPSSYPVPAQQDHRDGPEPEPMRAAIEFGDPRIQEYLISDFLGAAPGESWRWTGQKPELRLRLESVGNLRLTARLTFPHQSHEKLLPITASVFVNDKLLERRVFRKAGEHEYVRDVPAALVAPGENRVRFELDKVYIAEADGMKLGMVVSAIGFRARP